MAIDPLSLALMGGMGALGGLFGGSSGQPQSQTQYVQYLQPQLTPQQQSLQNMLYYGAMGNLYQPDQGYMDLLNQYIFGGGQPSGQPTTQQTAQDIISGYEEQVSAAKEAETQQKGVIEDIKAEILRPVYESARKALDPNIPPEEKTDALKEWTQIFMGKAGPKYSQKLQDLAGMSKEEADRWVRTAQLQAQKEVAPEAFKKEYHNAEDLKLLDTPAFQTTFKVITQPTEQPIEQTIEQITGQPGVTTPEQEFGQEGLLAKMMDPSYISEQFGLAKERGMGEISDWYEQAQRELEQRGIMQRGGYEGSGTERDVGGILSKRGEMETELGSRLREAQIGMEKQNWYDALNALTGLQTLQGNLQAQRSTPWINAAQGLANAPYGQMSTATTPGTSPGIFPGTLGGLYAGMGAYGMGQNLGFWGQQGGQSFPTTGYGSWNPNAYDRY